MWNARFTEDAIRLRTNFFSPILVSGHFDFPFFQVLISKRIFVQFYVSHVHFKEKCSHFSFLFVYSPRPSLGWSLCFSTSCKNFDFSFVSSLSVFNNQAKYEQQHTMKMYKMFKRLVAIRVCRNIFLFEIKKGIFLGTVSLCLFLFRPTCKYQIFISFGWNSISKHSSPLLSNILVFQLRWWRRRWRKVSWTWYWNGSNGWRCAGATAFRCLMTIRMIVRSRCWRRRAWFSIITIPCFSQTVTVNAARAIAGRSKDVRTVIMRFTRQRWSNTWMRSILVALVTKVSGFGRWRRRWLIDFLIMSVVRSMACRSCCFWTWRRINITDTSVCRGTWCTSDIVSVVAIRYGCSTIQRWHSHIIRYRRDFRYMRRFMGCRR